MSCDVGRRRGSDLALLWCSAVATAPIRPLAWEPSYATGAALEKAKRQKVKINKTKKTPTMCQMLCIRCDQGTEGEQFTQSREEKGPPLGDA